MATSTKEALAAALRQMMTVKPIDKVTVKDIVEICGVNRQTFYYHFDDVDDLLEWVFEQDSDRVFPQEVVYNHWMEDMMNYFDYLVSKDFEFVVEFYANCAIGFISQWMDMGMQFPKEITRERILRVMDQSIENILGRFTSPKYRPSY